MTVSILFSTIFEAALVIFGLWALFNEDKFIVFEERLVSGIKRRRLRVLKGGRNSDKSGLRIINTTRF